MDDQIASALESGFPDREVEDVRSAGPSWNEENRTVGIDFADGETVYLKAAIGGDGSRIARERGVLAYASANCEVPVPEVVAADPGGEVPYLATAPAPGRHLHELWGDADRTGRTALARQVGDALARVHAVRFDDHGIVVDGDADALDLETGPWTDVLVRTIEEMRGIAPSDRFDHHFDEVIAAVEANRETLDEAPAALLHGDVAQPNCYRADGEIGLLDWEIAHVGDPVRDIYRTRNVQIDSLRVDGPEPVVTAFREGYRERAGGLPPGFDDRRPVYEAVRFLGNSGFFERVAAHAGEPPEELADWIAEEMDRRIDAIRRPPG